MRWSITFAVALVAGAAACAGAADFPYTAVVTSTDVYVRSGPGQDYYPTDKLQKGERVEVWRHDPGGWYAVRPPRQSFSWVSSRHLTPKGGDLAEINTPRAVARVGSAFSDTRDIIQVRLDKGELVTLIGTPDADSPWCKVAPPAGEFRWVFSKYVERISPAELADADGGEIGLTAGIDGRGQRGEINPGDNARAVVVEQEINRLELELSALVAGDVGTWNFGELNRRTEQLLSQANSGAERGRARLLLDKVARFEEIRQRHDQLRRGPEVQAGARGDVPLPRPFDLTKFDGVGRLSPVISDKAGGPQFALVDSSNTVISFITPAPGVNLRPYVDHYVGVNGQRAYLSELQRQHISVQRISVLEVERR